MIFCSCYGFSQAFLEEYGEKVSPDVRGKIESAISNVESANKGDDKSAIDKALEGLNNEAMELGKVIYEAEAAKQQEAGGAPGAEEGVGAAAGGASPGGDDDVIDAEYEVKDEN